MIACCWSFTDEKPKHNVPPLMTFVGGGGGRGGEYGGRFRGNGGVTLGTRQMAHARLEWSGFDIIVVFSTYALWKPPLPLASLAQYGFHHESQQNGSCLQTCASHASSLQPGVLCGAQQDSPVTSSVLLGAP